jgi:hypothetical protein
MSEPASLDDTPLFLRLTCQEVPAIVSEIFS